MTNKEPTPAQDAEWLAGVKLLDTAGLPNLGDLQTLDTTGMAILDGLQLFDTTALTAMPDCRPG